MLLEVMVVGHVLCALVITALWWSKPRMVEEPTILRGEWTTCFAASMMTCSRLGLVEPRRLPGYRMLEKKAEISGLEVILEPPETDVENGDELTPAAPRTSVTDQVSIRSKSDTPRQGARDSAYDTTIFKSSDRERLMQTRWQLTGSVLQRYPSTRYLLHDPLAAEDDKYDTALTSYPEMPKKCRKRDTEVLWVVSIGFSGVHVAAWNSSFPSAVEEFSWHFSSVYIGVSGLLWATLHILAEHWAAFWWAWYDFMIGDVPKVLTLAVNTICGICGLAYVLARAYLIIEGFVELRALPAAAYIVPQ
ncbi:hypothetical protein BDZ85DRAFT_281306 [Elsinoe ampelina]|uniref:Uncharacterized protein n=1 Tax=Elsinoe ampelina TaxID=302913 RepID=A0A6A6GCG6_9PEZI|nr:hypothetical protein BDZ85DRAFT_281306 [Elsinoe ampelina]